MKCQDNFWPKTEQKKKKIETFGILNFANLKFFF